jgi:hypothetical protein
VDGAGPDALSAVGAPEAIGLRWTAVQGATGYRVYQRNADGTWPTTPTATTSGSTSYVLTGLVDGRGYAFRVTAMVNGSESRPSTVAESTPRNDVLLAAGDIAESNGKSELTAQLLDRNPGVVMTLGDNAYPNGTTSDYTSWYQPTWGRHLWRTHGAVGNHEYNSSSTGADYSAYFGDAAGPQGKYYYSYEVNGWHVVVLNSNCYYVGGCKTGSPQMTWLQGDLDASTAKCTIAVWHHPMFSSGNPNGTDSAMTDVWNLLMAHDVELVLNGHDHAYERFAPQDASGTAKPNGIREFIAGTGGGDLYPTATLLPNSQARLTGVAGILRLDLNAGGYGWQFLPVDGASSAATDSGTDTCH